MQKHQTSTLLPSQFISYFIHSAIPFVIPYCLTLLQFAFLFCTKSVFLFIVLFFECIAQPIFRDRSESFHSSFVFYLLYQIIPLLLDQCLIFVNHLPRLFLANSHCSTSSLIIFLLYFVLPPSRVNPSAPSSLKPLLNSPIHQCNSFSFPKERLV